MSVNGGAKSSGASRGWLVVVVGMGGIAAVVLVSVAMSSGESLPPGITPEIYQQAESSLPAGSKGKPERAEVLFKAAKLALDDEDPETAVAALSAIPDDNLEFGPAARVEESQILIRLNVAARAEAGLRRFFNIADDSLHVTDGDRRVAEQWLCYLYSVQLRLDERRVVQAMAHEAGRVDLRDSKQFYFPRLLIWNSSTGRRRLNEFLNETPEDLLLNIADARYLTSEGKLDSALARLQALVSQFPNHEGCRAAQLECLFERNDWDAIRGILESTPQSNSDSYLTRWLRAELAAHDGLWEDAVIAYQVALELDPASSACHMGLAKAYRNLGAHDKQQRAQEVALTLARIRVNLASVNDQNPDAVFELAADCRRIGLLDAADTFERHAQQIRQRSL